MLIFFLKLQARNLQLYKNEVIYMCSSRILVASSAGNFQTAIFKFEVLISMFCSTKITLERTTLPIFRSTPHIMPYPPIDIETFSPPPPPPPPLPLPHYSIFWRLHTLPFVNGEGWVGFKLWTLIRIHQRNLNTCHYCICTFHLKLFLGLGPGKNLLHQISYNSYIQIFGVEFVQNAI